MTNRYHTTTRLFTSGKLVWFTAGAFGALLLLRTDLYRYQSADRHSFLSQTWFHTRRGTGVLGSLVTLGVTSRNVLQPASLRKLHKTLGTELRNQPTDCSKFVSELLVAFVFVYKTVFELVRARTKARTDLLKLRNTLCNVSKKRVQTSPICAIFLDSALWLSHNNKTG